MLPFRRSNRVIALNDADIVECSDLENDDEQELDLNDALEVRERVATPRAHLASVDVDDDLEIDEVTVARRPLSSSSFLVPSRNASRAMVPALTAPSSYAAHTSFASHAPHAFEKPAPVMHIPRQMVETVRIAAVRTASDSSLTPSPSPFARSVIATGAVPRANHLMKADSVAPVALTVNEEDAPRKKMRRDPRDPDVDALVAASRGLAPRALRAVGLMLAGAVAAATLTAFAMRNDHDGNSANSSSNAIMEIAPQAPALSTATFVVPMKPVITQAVSSDVSGDVVPPTQVKFDEHDAVLVNASLPEVVSAAKTTVAATTLSSSIPAPIPTPRTVTKPKSTAATPSNALVPDADPPHRELPRIPARGTKDPVAEAQLRAAMR